MQQEYITKSDTETQAIAADVASLVREGGVICLYGDLGSGKTTFTQGLARSLGIKRNVNSPTFLVIRTYALDETMLYHIDLYRLTSEAEIRDIGLQEIVDDPKNIVVIEWSEKLGELLPEKRIDLHLSYLNEKERRITIDDYR